MNNMKSKVGELVTSLSKSNNFNFIFLKMQALMNEPFAQKSGNDIVFMHALMDKPFAQKIGNDAVAYDRNGDKKTLIVRKLDQSNMFGCFGVSDPIKINEVFNKMLALLIYKKSGNYKANAI